jgi:hypothetical protein
MRWRWFDGEGQMDRRSFVEAGADHLDARAGQASKTLILAKSLGSYATAWASSRRYPGIWLTPVLPMISSRRR